MPDGSRECNVPIDFNGELKMSAPDGYTERWDSETWNVGFVFRWSKAYAAWLECGRCTVKPGQSLCEAYAAWAGESMGSDYSIFFNKGF